MLVWIGQLLRLSYTSLTPGVTLFHATEHLLMPLGQTPTVMTVHDLIFKLFPQHHKRLNYYFLNAAMPLLCAARPRHHRHFAGDEKRPDPPLPHAR